jgi:hypothetical protein
MIQIDLEPEKRSSTRTETFAIGFTGSSSPTVRVAASRTFGTPSLLFPQNSSVVSALLTEAATASAVANFQFRADVAIYQAVYEEYQAAVAGRCQ